MEATGHAEQLGSMCPSDLPASCLSGGQMDTFRAPRRFLSGQAGAPPEGQCPPVASGSRVLRQPVARGPAAGVSPPLRLSLLATASRSVPRTTLDVTTASRPPCRSRRCVQPRPSQRQRRQQLPAPARVRAAGYRAARRMRAAPLGATGGPTPPSPPGARVRSASRAPGSGCAGTGSRACRSRPRRPEHGHGYPSARPQVPGSARQSGD